MKMPSTYISLLLFCGLMLFYTYARRYGSQNPGHASGRPLVKEIKPVVKRISPQHFLAVPLIKNNNGYEKELRQAALAINGFSFFKDVMCQIAPALKNAK